MGKMLRRDLAGSENLTVILFIIAAVVIVGSFIIGLMNPLFQAGEEAQSGVDALDMFGDVSIGAYWTPDTGTAITWSDATDNPIRSASSMIEYTLGTATCYLDVVRNNTYYLPGSTDWYRKYDDFTRGLYTGSNVAISYAAIENATQYHENGDTYSLVYPGWPFNSSTAFIFEFDDDSTEAMVTDQLWNNNTFTLYVAWVTSTSFEGGELAWYSVGWQIATFQYTPTDTAFDFIFSAFFDMLILTGCIVVFSRIFHGG